MKGDDSDTIVIDCSIALAWAFEDESNPYADSVQDALIRGSKAVVPSLWLWEVGNVLVSGERRKRITEAESTAFLANLAVLPITVVESRTLINLPEIEHVARKYNLTAYDAEYLHLAMETNYSLATNDKGLLAAAPQAGVMLFSP
jgi:predicted nucleic acid-binding protein